MKKVFALLCAATLLCAQDSKVLKNGYYLTIQDFINNTPTPAERETKVEEGRMKESGKNTPYFVRERDGNDSGFTKVRAKSFSGYCDNGTVYLVDNVDLLSGRTMRKVIQGKKYSYYFGTLHVAGGGGGMGGAGGFSMNMTTGGTVSTLKVIDMKTGETTTLKATAALKRKMRGLLSESPALYNEYVAAKKRTLEYAAIFIDKANSLEK